MTTLTADQSRTLENMLIEREKQLTAEIAAAREKSRQHEASRGSEVTDRKEDASDEAATEVSDAEIERDLNELKAVQAARLRFNAGLYGTCVDCEEPIALQRLMAQPAAVRCTRCQAGYEEKHALG